MNMETTEKERIAEKVLGCYEFIKHREDINSTLQTRIFALQFMERALGTDFKDTADLHEKMSIYISKLQGGADLKFVREKAKLSMSQLGEKLGYSKQFIYKMENGIKPITEKTKRFIDKQAQYE